jgi:hypothetical protein
MKGEGNRLGLVCVELTLVYNFGSSSESFPFCPNIAVVVSPCHESHCILTSIQDLRIIFNIEDELSVHVL